MSAPERNAAVVDWLKERGYTAEEIEKILARLAVHDENTATDALFDSFGQGGQTLDAIIRDALKE